MKFLIGFLLAVSTLAQIPTKVTNCMPNPKVVFTAATFSVTPAKGVNETITIYGTAKDHAELSNVLLKAKWNGLDSFEENYPEDDVYDEGDPVTYSMTQNFPTYTPAGKIVVQLYFQNAKKIDFACAEVGFTV